MVSTAYRRPPLRLTRRGRAVVLGFFIVLASVASAILLTTASRAEQPRIGPAPSVPAPSVVVQPDDTLWSIATRTAPRRDPYAAVAEIREINGIEGYVVHPGQTLELPRS
ncbi:LysM peptidoglycan-binding domain-containing protein [Actinoplanes sp. NPDC051633]|uniref:LysM peptidoglycan-binding domain-containing protein n=1 Tax=Actinoplanes sp. NPDC051633 TaxID=3155670 RepID=UPI0034264AC1